MTQIFPFLCRYGSPFTAPQLVKTEAQFRLKIVFRLGDFELAQDFKKIGIQIGVSLGFRLGLGELFKIGRQIQLYYGHG